MMEDQKTEGENPPFTTLPTLLQPSLASLVPSAGKVGSARGVLGKVRKEDKNSIKIVPES